MNKKRIVVWINILVAVIIVSIVLFVVTKPNEPAQTDIDIVKCIADNSVLYSQLGCSACETQEELFGENYKYLNVIDCFYELDKCQEITATPTWKIKGEFYKGVKSIEQLQELTGC